MNSRNDAYAPPINVWAFLASALISASTMPAYADYEFTSTIRLDANMLPTPNGIPSQFAAFDLHRSFSSVSEIGVFASATDGRWNQPSGLSFGFEFRGPGWFQSISTNSQNYNLSPTGSLPVPLDSDIGRLLKSQASTGKLTAGLLTNESSAIDGPLFLQLRIRGTPNIAPTQILYLNFDGGRGAKLNLLLGDTSSTVIPAYTADGLFGQYKPLEIINETVRRVHNIFEPFNIAITTIRPTSADDLAKTSEIVVGRALPSIMGLQNVVGVAQGPDVRNRVKTDKAFVFASMFDGQSDIMKAQLLASTIAHESGHLFGLLHTASPRGNIMNKLVPFGEQTNTHLSGQPIFDRVVRKLVPSLQALYGSENEMFTAATGIGSLSEIDYGEAVMPLCCFNSKFELRDMLASIYDVDIYGVDSDGDILPKLLFHGDITDSSFTLSIEGIQFALVGSTSRGGPRNVFGLNSADGLSFGDLSDDYLTSHNLQTGSVFQIYAFGTDNLPIKIGSALIGGNTTMVPEPTSLLLMLLGIGFLGFATRANRSKRKKIPSGGW